MRAQIPFTGGSGRFLNLGLKRAGLAKSDVFTTNAVHCHPPGNRASLPHEIENCRPYLLRELAIIQPHLVIGLGKDASAALRGIFSEARELPCPSRRRAVDAETRRSPIYLQSLTRRGSSTSRRTGATRTLRVSAMPCDGASAIGPLAEFNFSFANVVADKNLSGVGVMLAWPPREEELRMSA
ncbi:uracil-DNA glycosylase family protein [Mycobacterium sp. 155]|uniref:uracil-DNA glycosylase family protein n=1 Tax=Mycobacterium sp. 155 TaxID=1157943 RepID=UPI001E4673A2|nr:uracil-DNA glycosylase family protein [Mycobacterium sp. 155]